MLVYIIKTKVIWSRNMINSDAPAKSMTEMGYVHDVL